LRLMKFFRYNIVKSAFIFVWCTTLLHMTFFMAEVEVLKLTENRALIENAIKLLASTSFEEESDSSESHETRGAFKEVEFFANNLLHAIQENKIRINQLKNFVHIGGTLTGHFDTFSPPPDHNC
jgi:hypothetical protein